MKKQQKHICNKSLQIKGMRGSGWKVLCLQKFQAQSLCAPALYKTTYRLVGARKKVCDMNEEQKKGMKKEKREKRKKYHENKEEVLTYKKKRYQQNFTEILKKKKKYYQEKKKKTTSRK